MRERMKKENVSKKKDLDKAVFEDMNLINYQKVFECMQLLLHSFFFKHIATLGSKPFWNRDQG